MAGDTEASAVGEGFDEVVLPHLHAAHQLARWLMRNEHDAEDVVQEASLRAFRYFRTFTGGNGRAWLLRIVRNTCWSWRGRNGQALTEPFDEEQHGSAGPASDPETLLLQTDDVRLIERAMASLPDRFRDVLILRELEGLSYRELAEAMGWPAGTVMSSLSRARRAFRGALENELRRPVFQRGHVLENRRLSTYVCESGGSGENDRTRGGASAIPAAQPATSDREKKEQRS